MLCSLCFICSLFDSFLLNLYSFRSCQYLFPISNLMLQRWFVCYLVDFFPVSIIMFNICVISTNSNLLCFYRFFLIFLLKLFLNVNEIRSFQLFKKNLLNLYIYFSFCFKCFLRVCNLISFFYSLFFLFKYDNKSRMDWNKLVKLFTGLV